MGDEHPGLGALDGFFPIPCQTAATAEPCEGALHDPSARQQLEALCGVGPLDDLQRPAPEADKGGAQLWSGIAAICKHVTKLRGLAPQPGEDPGRAIPILNAGGMDFAGDQVAAGVGDDVAFPPFDRKREGNPVA